jgi:hypothetical protein
VADNDIFLLKICFSMIELVYTGISGDLFGGVETWKPAV